MLAAVADGHLDLDGAVADWWPAYGVHGKGSTTVRQLLSHQAGIPFFPAAATEVAFDDAVALTALLADSVPDHEPGTAVAEHALTYGHLCDALVAAATGESLAQRFARIADAHGWDLHLRVRPEDLPRSRMSRWSIPGGRQGTSTTRTGVRPWAAPGLLDPEVLNGARFRTTSFPAIAMHASARGLARFYDDLTDVDGAVAALLGADLYREYVGAAATGFDRVIGREVTWTLGFQLDASETGWSEIGMGGAGGCSAWASYENGYAAAYVTRGLGRDVLGTRHGPEVMSTSSDRRHRTSRPWPRCGRRWQRASPDSRPTSTTSATMPDGREQARRPRAAPPRARHRRAGAADFVADATQCRRLRASSCSCSGRPTRGVLRTADVRVGPLSVGRQLRPGTRERATTAWTTGWRRTSPSAR